MSPNETALRQQIRVMADWLELLAAVVEQERGPVRAVADSRKAAADGRELADPPAV